MKEEIILKIRSESEPGKVAGAIAVFIKEGKKVKLQAIGAGAVNQAVKSIITARGFLALDGVNLYCIPAFTEVDVGGKERTGIIFILKEDF